MIVEPKTDSYRLGQLAMSVRLYLLVPTPEARREVVRLVNAILPDRPPLDPDALTVVRPDGRVVRVTVPR